MSVAHIGKVQENTAALCKMVAELSGKPYQRIRICLTREVETPSFPIWCLIRICLPREVETLSFPIRRQVPDVKYPEKVERRPDKIPDVRYPEMVERRPDKIPDVRYPKKVERRPDRIPPRVE